jgi:hypothetical protein
VAPMSRVNLPQRLPDRSLNPCSKKDAIAKFH